MLLLVWDDPTSRNILGYKVVSKSIFFLYFILPISITAFLFWEGLVVCLVIYSFLGRIRNVLD